MAPSKNVGLGKPDLETSNAGFRWVRVILSLGFSILLQEFWNWGLAVSQGLEFTILFLSFDWQIRSLLIVPKRPIVYLPTFNSHFELLINLSDSIVSKIDVG